MLPNTTRAAGAFILAIGVVTHAFALTPEVKIEPGQRPPAAAETIPAPKPAACVAGKSGFRTDKGVHAYVVELTSACDKRQRCSINAHVTGSLGAKTRKTAFIIPKAAPGQEARKVWSVRTAEFGGEAHMSWRCDDI